MKGESVRSASLLSDALFVVSSNESLFCDEKDRWFDFLALSGIENLEQEDDGGI
jgi:hypothetical protein